MQHWVTKGYQVSKNILYVGTHDKFKTEVPVKAVWGREMGNVRQRDQSRGFYAYLKFLY